jgi:hypothetical protein
MLGFDSTEIYEKVPTYQLLIIVVQVLMVNAFIYFSVGEMHSQKQAGLPGHPYRRVGPYGTRGKN